MQGASTGCKLSVEAVFGVSRILRQNAQHLSPATGLLLSSCPQLIANTRGFPNTRDTNLARELYFQREDKKTGRRYGPVAVVGSRSHAAYWLDAKALGIVVGTAISDVSLQVRILAPTINIADQKPLYLRAETSQTGKARNIND
jgi:hypothetical protein